MTQALSSELRSCLNAGQRLGSYRVIRQLSEGGLAVVFEAIHENGRRSAIKILHPKCPDTEEILLRFFNEAEALRRVQHPGVVAFLERDRFPDGSHYIVMEYLEGTTLRDRLQSTPHGYFSEPEALEWTRQIASALHAIHSKNIVHRNVRPENVFIVKDTSGRERAKLSGFGTAQLPGELQRSRHGDGAAADFALSGTEYAAPEQCEQRGPVDGRADVYALGTMLYEMLAGHRPVEGTWMERLSSHMVQEEQPLPVDKLQSITSPETLSLLGGMLAKSPASRITARQVSERGEQLMELRFPHFVPMIPHSDSAPPREGVKPGDQIGHYRVVRTIQDGGMGVVFEAVHQKIERRVAVKVLKEEYVQNQQVVTRFLNEARAVNLVGHPGLVEIFDHGHFADGRPYIVMEFLDGILLSRRLEDAGRSFPPRDAIHTARQIAQIMEAVHKKNIVHRDLKPDNIMLMSRLDEQGEVVKIIDFGVARLPGRTSEVTQSGMLLGTPLYMPPEQCMGKGDVDAKADVYALGGILYQMLVGRTPFVADEMGVAMMMQIEQTPPPLPAALGLPADLSNLVMQMLAKSVTERPTMEAVALALARLELLFHVKLHGGHTMRMGSHEPQFPPKGVPEHLSFLDEVDDIIQRRLSSRLMNISLRVLQTSAARWPVLRNAIAQVQTGLAMPMPSAPANHFQGNRTIAIEPAGDIAMGWLMAIVGYCKDQTYRLKERTVIGSAPDCDIVIADPFMSARHCEIRKVEGGFKLVDLGSTNGTIANDKRVKEHFLVDNDNFRVGRIEFKFKSIFS